MVSQAKGGCKVCKSMQHTAMHHNPKKPIKRTAIKRSSKEKLQIKAKPKKITRSKLVKDLDSIFSWYIRLRYAVSHDAEKMAVCVTCKSMKRWQDQQNGHFYTRGRQATRWDEINCQVQCLRCNMFLKGNYINYTIYMIDKFGREKLEELERKSLSSEKIPTIKLKEMIDYYRGQVDILLK